MIVKGSANSVAGTLRDYGRVASTLLAWPLLGMVWLALLWNFFTVMAPRFARIGATAIVNTWPCNAPDCDFSTFWPAGILARTGDFASLYQPALFAAWRQHFLSGAAQRLDWYYPPPALLPAEAISYLPFNLAFAAWTVLQLVIAFLLLRAAGLARGVILLGLLSPAALWNMEMGNIGIFCGACTVAGLLLADQAPFFSGAIISLLLCKPQSGLLAPLALLASRNIRAILAGLAVAALLLGLETAALGPAVWVHFFSTGLAAARLILTAEPPIGAERGVSVFWMLRGFGFGIAAAYAGQAVVAVIAFGLTWRLWTGRTMDNLDRMACTVFLCLLATPYGYVNDMVAYSIALAALARARGWRIDVLDTALWLWPAICPVVWADFHMLLTPLASGLAAAQIFWRARKQPRGADLPRAAAVLPRAG
jgi:hypothetical protein